MATTSLVTYFEIYGMVVPDDSWFGSVANLIRDNWQGPTPIVLHPMVANELFVDERSDDVRTDYSVPVLRSITDQTNLRIGGLTNEIHRGNSGRDPEA